MNSVYIHKVYYVFFSWWSYEIAVIYVCAGVRHKIHNIVFEYSLLNKQIKWSKRKKNNNNNLTDNTLRLHEQEYNTSLIDLWCYVHHIFQAHTLAYGRSSAFRFVRFGLWSHDSIEMNKKKTFQKKRHKECSDITKTAQCIWKL